MQTRHSCNRLVWQSLRNGSKAMDTRMAELLGITIDSSHGEERTVTQVSASPPLSNTTSSIYIESLSIAACLRDSILAISSQGMSKLSLWPNSYRVWDPYWGFTAIMTTGDSAIALAITVHSRTLSAAEILTTEFVACQIVADIAWQDDSTQNDFERRAKENIEHRSKSALRRLPIRIISIHRRNIRILDTTFTEEYYKSLSKAGQTSVSSLYVYIKSLPTLGYDDTEITHLAQLLMTNASQRE